LHVLTKSISLFPKMSLDSALGLIVAARSLPRPATLWSEEVIPRGMSDSSGSRSHIFDTQSPLAYSHGTAFAPATQVAISLPQTGPCAPFGAGD
jgi:hypothetical protein